MLSCRILITQTVRPLTERSWTLSSIILCILYIYINYCTRYSISNLNCYLYTQLMNSDDSVKNSENTSLYDLILDFIEGGM